MTGQSSDSPIAGARTDAELEEALSDLDGKDFSNRAPDLCKRILARLLRIHSKQLESSKLDDCLRAAFDVYASEIKTDGHQLTDQLLKNRIPGWVFNWAVIKHWLPYPPMRQSRHSVTYLDSKPRRPMHEPVPESQLTEMLGAYRIPDWWQKRHHETPGRPHRLLAGGELDASKVRRRREYRKHRSFHKIHGIHHARSSGPGRRSARETRGVRTAGCRQTVNRLRILEESKRRIPRTSV